MNTFKKHISTVLLAAVAIIPMEPKSGSEVSGQITLKDKGDKAIEIQYDLKGLKPKSMHGFHVHEKGDCSDPEAKSAGAHFNPGGKPHGSPHSSEKHAGDLGNIKADKIGLAKGSKTFKGLSLTGTNRIEDLALVVHKAADNFKSQPSGDSGDRVSCGVIKIENDPATTTPANVPATTPTTM